MVSDVVHSTNVQRLISGILCCSPFVIPGFPPATAASLQFKNVQVCLICPKLVGGCEFACACLSPHACYKLTTCPGCAFASHPIILGVCNSNEGNLSDFGS